MSEPRARSPRKLAAKVATPDAPRARGRAAAETAAVSHDEIARRAYELAHGEHAGTDEENWLRAEQQLRGGSAGG